MLLLRKSPFPPCQSQLPTSDLRLHAGPPSVRYGECFRTLHELESLIEIDNPSV